MAKITLTTLDQYKQQGQKFACLTAYDACFTRAISEAGIELILIGDSLGMVLQGADSTLPVTLEEMAYHTRCVKQGQPNALIMADMPFASYTSVTQALDNAAILMRAGAQVVKLEGGAWLADSIQALSQQGIPVCAHLGLTPQSVHQLGGYRVQGKTEQQAQQILDDARTLEQAGARLLLVECIPQGLGAQLQQQLTIPVIGIGAGAEVDAQVLVMHDLLGLSPRTPRFVRNFMQDASSIQGAFADYAQAVKQGDFPAAEHCF